MDFKPDVDPTKVMIETPGIAVQVQLGSSGILPLGPRDVRVTCPKCGSPAIVTFATDDPHYGNEIPGFACRAGDCKYHGVALRRPV